MYYLAGRGPVLFSSSCHLKKKDDKTKSTARKAGLSHCKPGSYPLVEKQIKRVETGYPLSPLTY